MSLLFAFFISLNVFAAAETPALFPEPVTSVTTLRSAQCRDPRGLPLKMSDSTTLAPSCTPDTLYSWGSFAKVQAIWAKLKDVKSWAFTWRTLYTSQAPIATFGYGDIPIRLKLKPGVRFVYFKKTYSVPTKICDEDTERNLNAVYFRGRDIYADIVVCSPQVLHSISYETKLHYNEMIRDYRHQKQTPETAMVYSTQQTEGIFGADVDTFDFSEQTLLSRLSQLLKYIEAGKGDLIYNPAVGMNDRTERQHFSTTYPTYFNQRAQVEAVAK